MRPRCMTSPSVKRPWASALHTLWPWLAAVLSGILQALCLAPWNQGWLCWLALTPLLCAVWFSPIQTARRQAALGYVTGLVFFTATFYWLSSLGTLFGEFWLKGIPLALALYLGLYFAFWGWFMGQICAGRPADFARSTRNIFTGLLGAAAWVAQEWIRSWLFSGFGWNGLGVALHAELAMIQIVDLTGLWGLSFLVAYCNVMAVIIVRRLIAEMGPVFLKRVRWEFSLTMALVAAVFSYGVRALLPGRHPAQATTKIKIAAIQPNIPQTEKFSPESEDRVLAQLETLTALAATAKPDLLLWPESATPRGMYADERNYQFVIKQVASEDFALLIGTIDSDDKTHESFNTATLLTAHGKDIQSYRKMHLVPFGEYMPLRQSFPLFAMIAGELVPSDFTPGRDFTVLDLHSPPLKFAALVCFEDSLGDLTRRFVCNGAEILVNLTNDGWFLETAGAQQHFDNAIFRAVENRRPLVRCTNTGITASVEPSGRIDRWLAPFQQGFAVRELSVPQNSPQNTPQKNQTFYTRHGDWLPHLCAGLTALVLSGLAARALKRNGAPEKPDDNAPALP